MSKPTPDQQPSSTDSALQRYYARMADELQDVHHGILSELTRALVERGWTQPRAKLVERLSELGLAPAERVGAALDELVGLGLLEIHPETGAILTFLGVYAFSRTPHRAHLDSGVDVFTLGAMDLLTVPSTLRRAARVHTVCPVTDTPIQLRLEAERVVSASPSGLAGFMASWDGAAPLGQVARESPLFADNDALEAWQAQHPEVQGLAMPSELLLWVGLQGAQELGTLRFRLL